MEIFSWDDLLLNKIKTNASSVTIGGFDGIHLGHQKLINKTIELSKKENLDSVVVTFSKSPREFFNKNDFLGKISTLDLKLDIFKKLAISTVILIDFSADFGRMNGESFIALLCNKLRMKFLTVGSDFVFGHNRDTDVSVLEKLSQKNGFALEVIKPVQLDGERISSSIIRKYIKNGEIEKAVSMLGSSYCLEVPSVDKYTFNIDSINQVVPSVGVYSVIAEDCNGKTYTASCTVDSFQLSLTFLTKPICQIKKLFFSGNVKYK